jgi:hypothetical protein
VGATCVRRAVLLVAAALLFAAAPSADAKPRLRCSSGTTLLVDGPLRIFAVAFRDRDERGHDHYACLGGRGRPLRVGQDDDGPDAAVERMLDYSFAGGRYLLAAIYGEDEAGQNGDYTVFDLRAHRRVAKTDLLVDLEAGAQFGLAADGSLVVGDEGVVSLLRAGSPKQGLSPAGVTAGDVALSGTTLYWTETPQGAPPVARSAQLGGAAAPPGDRLEPVEIRRGGACTRRSGETVLRSSRVRVLRRGTGYVACRFGDGRAVRLPAETSAADLRVVADRWLFVRAGARAQVIDMRSLQTVTQVDAPAATALLDDGTLAWNEAGGRLLAAAPGAAPHELAATGAGALASSRTTVYWTADGTPQRFQPSGARPRAAIPGA